MAVRIVLGVAVGALLLGAGYQAFGLSRPVPATASAPGPAPTADSLAAATAQAGAARVHEQGREIYNFRCYFCHGYSGDARTLAASYLSPAPRDFRAATPQQLPLPAILSAVRDGRPGTAMKSFQGILSDVEMQAVAAFVADEFVRDKAPNTAYHTPENGWPAHRRFEVAYPFARGEVALDAPVESLSPAQLEGRQLFMTSCVSCHDRGRVVDEGPAWSSRPVSFPRMGFVPGQSNTPPVDAVSTASVYAKHEVVPRVEGLSPLERRGQDLFQANCAFCHGGDGTGKNWIGQFMEPKARDLTIYSAQSMPASRLEQVIREGLPGTSMPAWQHVFAPAEIQAVRAYVMRVFFKAS